MDYNLLKALHIASDFIWFAGVVVNGLVLSIAARAPGTMPQPALVRFRFWDLWVFNTAQGFAYIFGIWLVIAGGWTFDTFIPDGWLLAKLVFVFALSGIHGSQTAALRKLAAGKPAARRTRLVRYSPPVALVCALAISLLVILKPF